MWAVSYWDLETDTIQKKCGFASDKFADNWVKVQEKAGNIVPINLLVWSVIFQDYKVVFYYYGEDQSKLVSWEREGEKCR